MAGPRVRGKLTSSGTYRVRSAGRRAYIAESRGKDRVLVNSAITNSEGRQSIAVQRELRSKLDGPRRVNRAFGDIPVNSRVDINIGRVLGASKKGYMAGSKAKERAKTRKKFPEAFNRKLKATGNVPVGKGVVKKVKRIWSAGKSKKK